jgi:hypothetical protein
MSWHWGDLYFSNDATLSQLPELDDKELSIVAVKHRYADTEVISSFFA